MEAFEIDNMPSQEGRIAIVTGANTGLGYETALALAKKQAHVVMACRNLDKATAAKERIIKIVPKARLEIIQLDLNSLDSVRVFAKDYASQYNSLDILINNAGLMIPPFKKTKDGFRKSIWRELFGSLFAYRPLTAFT
jgi:NAD(P)-dependent dehydrogenase (short-subunit alcohol dehydrogenase family)